SVSCSPEYRAFPPGRTILRRTKTNRLSAEAQCEPFLTPGFVRATSWVYVASQEVATDCITRSESLKNCAACPLGSKADICNAKQDVRFAPESGHVRCKIEMSALGSMADSCGATKKAVIIRLWPKADMG